MHRLPPGISYPILLVVSFFIVACADVPRSRDGLILENVNVIDVQNGRVIRDQDVLIENGRISTVEPHADAQRAGMPPRRDMQDAYLTPALYDLHVHIFDKRDLQTNALMGIQTVRNLDGWDWHLELRDNTDDTGPWVATLVTSGRQFQKPLVGSSKEIIAGIIEDRAAGFDWIKLYDDLDRDMLDSIAAAKLSEIKITGHLPDNIVLSDVLRSGVYSDIAHAEELLQAMKAQNPQWHELIDRVAIQMIESSTALTATLVNYKMIVDQASDFSTNISRSEVAFAAPLLQMFWNSDFNHNKNLSQKTAKRLAKNFEEMGTLVAALSARGVVILAGSDAPNPTTVPAFSLHEELELLTEAGLSPAEAIRSATVDAAGHLGQGRTEGQLVEGAKANIIVTRDNPLDDVTALRSFEALVKNGMFKSRHEIDAELATLRSEYAADLEYVRLFTPAGPTPIFDRIRASDRSDPISESALVSLIWIYVKFGNLEAATLVAEETQARFPSESSEANLRYVRQLDHKAPHKHE